MTIKTSPLGSEPPQSLYIRRERSMVNGILSSSVFLGKIILPHLSVETHFPKRFKRTKVKIPHASFELVM